MDKSFSERDEVILVKGVFEWCSGINKSMENWVVCFKFGDGMYRSFKFSDIQNPDYILECLGFMQDPEEMKGELIHFYTEMKTYQNATVSHGLYEEYPLPPNTTTASANGIPKPMLDRLISLCDPAKHGNDKEAMTAYGWLVSSKEEHYDATI